MRNPLSSLITGFILCWLAHSLPAQQVKVMQWNIHGNLGNINSNNTAAAKALARIVNYNQPDVLLFCEVDDNGVAANVAALTDWVTNNIPYMGTSSGVTFWVSMATLGDGYERNGAISRYPVSNDVTYDDGLRGLHSFTVHLISTNLQVFHAHLKCCSDDCTRKQNEAQFDANTISAFAATSPLPYIFGGDWNEDEEKVPPVCPLTNGYHPITTIRQDGGLAEFKPTTLDGEYRTWSTSPSTPSVRFDYLLAATNRLTPTSGYVFSTMDWASHGLYTNGNPQNLVNDSKTSSDHYSVFAVYDFPTNGNGAVLAVSPPNDFSSVGNLGGPFTPPSQTYTLSNAGPVSFNWTAAETAAWLSLSVTSGTLLAGSSTNVTVSINTNANNLSSGSYSDTVRFTNTTAASGNTTRSATLTVTNAGAISSFGFYDDFGTFSSGNLVGQSNWTQVGTVSTLPLQVSGGQVVIPFGQSADNQDAYKNFPTTNGTVFYGMTLTVSNAPVSASPSYFTALYTGNNASGFANYRLTARDNGGVTYLLGARITGQSGDPYTFGATGLSYGTQHRVIVEADSGGTVMEVFVDPTNSNLGAQTTYLVNNIGTGTAPTSVGSLVISQFGTNTTFNDGVAIGKVVVSDNFATVYNDLNTTLTVFQNWQIQYFGSTNNPAAAPEADPDADAMSNMAEFLAGTNPTNSASVLRISAITPEGNDIRVTWTMGSGKTNALQAALALGGSLSDNFSNIFTVTNTVGSVTNYLHVGAATSSPARYYRVRVGP